MNLVEVGDAKLIATDTRANEAPIEGRVVSQIRSLEQWYAAEFERRLTELSGILQAQLDSKVEEVRAHYEKQGTGKPSSTETHERVVEEIRKSEADNEKLVSELERMVADDSVALGKLLQKRSQELELKAYIRGLRFKAGASNNPTSEQAGPTNPTK